MAPGLTWEGDKSMATIPRTIAFLKTTSICSNLTRPVDYFQGVVYYPKMLPKDRSIFSILLK
jgi:hypothetical protein